MCRPASGRYENKLVVALVSAWRNRYQLATRPPLCGTGTPHRRNVVAHVTDTAVVGRRGRHVTKGLLINNALL
jgi:hypothetical protein